MLEQLIGGGNLADDLVTPVPGYVAIGANRPYAGPVGIMDGVFIFPVNIIPYFMTGYAERLGIGQFHGPVKPPPQQDTRHECEYQRDAGGFNIRA